VITTPRLPVSPDFQEIPEKNLNEEQPAVALLDEGQAAALLSCSKALLRKWRSSGHGPGYIRVGRLVRYARRDIQAFLEAHRVTTGGSR
jgi:hypothetical protein